MKLLNYLEETIVLGSFATEVTNEVKENRFSRGKVCPHCGYDAVSRNGKYNGKQRYTVNPAERLLLTLHAHHVITARGTLGSGYFMLSA